MRYVSKIFVILIFICSKINSQTNVIVGDTTSSNIYYNNIKDTALSLIGKNVSYYELDLENDNTPDIQFAHAHNSSPSFSEITRAVKALSNEIEFVLLNNSYADSSAYFSILNKSLNWSSFSVSGYRLHYSFYGIPAPWGPGTFEGGVFKTSNCYLAFRKTSNTDTIYGWIQLNMNNTFTIKAYAFENRLLNINDLSDNGISINTYPSPISSSTFYLETEEEIKKLNICDVFGNSHKLKYSKNKLNKYEITLPDDISSGLYFININIGLFSISKKIIITR